MEDGSDTVLYSDVNVPTTTYIEPESYLDDVEGELGQLQEKRVSCISHVMAKFTVNFICRICNTPLSHLDPLRTSIITPFR